MFEKHLWKSDILSKDAGHRPASLLKMSLFYCFFLFKHFASKNQLPGFYISGTLVENGLEEVAYQSFVLYLRMTLCHAFLAAVKLRQK